MTQCCWQEVGAELAQLLDVALANAHSSFRTEHNVSMADPLTVKEKAEFDATVAADLTRQTAAPKQGPLSDAYLSGRKGNDKEEKAAASAVQQPRQLLVMRPVPASGTLSGVCAGQNAQRSSRAIQSVYISTRGIGGECQLVV